ncbi:PKD domain-containing protein [Flammeovirga pectinis]|uniref:PKD domain-containing protein n=1 Tax=Flammeovirga pectinis TaxID=2494373 RepID=A0A3S9PBG7_9BACT|nr:PKD domain-containing protein [Flammeovirga pectinis]AZQ65570.1 PKD domain-containing protein [Flammeovirga pectinis]
MKQQIENKFWLFTKLIGTLMSLSIATLWSCSTEEVESIISLPPQANFESAVDGENTLLVNFTNSSTGAVGYAWDFGDNLGTSVEENASYTYEEAGDYSVKLIATNAAGVTNEVTKSISVVAPGTETLIAGKGSKTWKLYRECYSMLIGSSDKNKGEWVALINDGARDCLYQQEWIFKSNGTVEFKDNGYFWGEHGPFGTSAGDNLLDQCFTPSPSTMKNVDNEDVSAWGSGSHKYTYDAVEGKLVLEGNGAWMVVPKLLGGEGEEWETMAPFDGAQITPTSTIIEEHEGYDLMRVVFNGPTYNEAVYVSYDNWDDEPEINIATEESTSECMIDNVVNSDPCNEVGDKDVNVDAIDWEDIVLTELSNTFIAEDDDNVKGLTTANSSGVIITPASVGPNDELVGMYERTESEWADAQFYFDEKDASFENFTTVSVEVYFPSTNDYSGALAKKVEIFIRDSSEDGGNSWKYGETYAMEDIAEGEWVTVKFDLTDCNKSRNDLDLVGLVIGGGGHLETGTFYIRNFMFE